ncbi:skin secretory protein xP2-like [Hordeum vulgare subsp. vulgare]|uniref:skin secretory protein xP2-like n=1 Tax=Hordeum vulgare subsp. vulgare TaxID=112509 RepID=UPI001D1A3FB8|nr:skin secretory protein xP2-like [Hordeum vulgare subsp. vulgare]
MPETLTCRPQAYKTPPSTCRHASKFPPPALAISYSPAALRAQETAKGRMGNCGLKPKALGDDDAPPPAELPTPAAGAEQEVAPPAEVEEAQAQAPAEETSRAVEQEGTATAADRKEHEEPKETEGKELPKEKEAAGEEAGSGGELPPSTPASVA